MSTQIVANVPQSIFVNGQKMIFKFYCKSTDLRNQPSAIRLRISAALANSGLDFHSTNTNTPGQSLFTVRCSGLREATQLGNLLTEEGYPLL